MFCKKNRAKNYIRASFVVILLFINSPIMLIAGVKNVTGSLKLSATVNNQPAFLPVTWKIILKEPTVHKLVRIVRKHAATIDLEPGNYHILLSIGDKELSKPITIFESKQHKVVIDVNNIN